MRQRLNVQKQKGAVLIIALVMLLILTVLGVAVMESSVIEERMAGNAIDRNRAFQAAEATLRIAEDRIAGLTAQPIPSDTVGSFVHTLGAPSSSNTSWWTDANWDWADGQEANLSAAGWTDLSNNPRYVIEQYDFVCDGAITPVLSECKIAYRITAHAWGARNATVTLQSLYTRRY